LDTGKTYKRASRSAAAPCPRPETVLPKHEQHKQALYRFLKLPLKVKSGGRHRPDREPILRRASAKPRSSQTIRISVVQTVPDTNLNLT
jgi:hypothetical protein